MKKILWILVSVMMLSLTAVSASAVQYVYDNGNILTDSEEAYLESLAESEGAKYGISIVILTEDGIGGADPMMYAADFYDDGGFLDDGVILFLEMEERDWQVVNTGMMMNVIESYELDYIGNNAVPYFSKGDYAEGFEAFILIASDFTDRYLYGSSDDYYYEDDYYYGDDYYDGYAEDELGFSFYAIAFVVSLIIAFLVCSVFKKQLTTAVKKSGASDYFKSENANITHSADRFLYSRTSKVRKSSDNSSGSRSGGSSRSFSSSSGRSHSGGGGKF